MINPERTAHGPMGRALASRHPTTRVGLRAAARSGSGPGCGRSHLRTPTRTRSWIRGVRQAPKPRVLILRRCDIAEPPCPGPVPDARVGVAVWSGSAHATHPAGQWPRVATVENLGRPASGLRWGRAPHTTLLLPGRRASGTSLPVG